MIIRSRVSHRVSFSSYLKYVLMYWYNVLPSVFAKPIVSEKKFIFITGCGHSGTTLMAAKLGNHSDIMPIGRETGVLLPGNHSLLTVKAILNEWCYFSEINNSRYILEKTPKHIYSYDRVQKIAPNNYFIVMLRNPLDTIASLYKRFGDLEFCIQRWILDNTEALHLVGKPNVIFVKYEDFTNASIVTIKKVVDFVGVVYEDQILDSTESVYSKVAQKDNMKIREQQVSKPIRPNSGGWSSVFDSNKAEYILSRVKAVAKIHGYES